MKTSWMSILVVIAQLSLPTFTASAHPGSGIVVDQEGNVYFTHFGRGVGKIDPQGKLTYVGETRGGHWMCLDVEGGFSRTQPKHFQRITPDRAKPALIYADGGSPIAVLRDGNQLKDGDVDYPDNNPRALLPALRGLAVEEDGTVFAGGVGCHAVAKISSDGRKVETVLKAERPWSPTGVAVHRGEVYVLEYTNANGSPNEGWRPRVRKLGRDSKITVLMVASPEATKSESK